ncbi:MAG: hypothetical protein KIT40_16710 [Nitrospira sp.]|nr:hypothetical protein [Nitrospira sp.]
MRVPLTITGVLSMLLSIISVPPGQAQSAPSLTGTVQQYLLSPHGEVDGLLLSNGSVIRFPPHLGLALATTVKTGDAITATGFIGPRTSQGRAMNALSITNSNTGQTLIHEPPITPPLPPHLRGLTGTALTVRGTVARFVVNPHGDIDRLILSGGEEITFAPHQGALIVLALARIEGPITIAGFGARTAFGTVVNGETMTSEDRIIWTRE